MNTTERRKLAKLIRLLNEAATLADEMELLLDNGAFVGSIVGGCADELELRLGMREAG